LARHPGNGVLHRSEVGADSGTTSWSASSLRGKEVYEDKTQILAELPILGHWQLHEAVPGALRPDSHKDEFELHLVQEGCMDLWMDTPANSFAVTGGTAILCQPGQVHGGVHDVLHPGRWFWLRLTAPKGNSAGFLGLAPKLIGPLLDDLRTTQPQTFAYSPSLENCFERLLNEHRQPTVETPLLARCILLELVAWIVRDRRNAMVRSAGLSRGYSPEIQKAIAWLEIQDEYPVPVRELAAMANMSESSFRRRFCRETGYSPYDYMMHSRIERAKTMLTDTRQSITTIAMSLGFSTSAHFAAMFRRRTGIKPSRFREQHVGKAAKG
jgi:AraC-like DNA-binding protein